MSPEQASGQRVVLDHRTDIYSLGATFYELMTLRPVFSGKTRQALLADVLGREPRPLRSLDRRIPAELDLIVLKALSKNPGDRYASAQDLADDLHRYLRDEPIRAKSPSLAEHARKWARRHPSIIAAGVFVLLVTLIGSLVSNWLVTDANRRAKAALAEAKLRAEEAEKRFRQARQAADLLVDLSEKELADKPPIPGLRKRLLEAAIAYYQDFISQPQGDAASRAELIAVRDRLKKSLDDLTVLEGAGQFLLLADRRVQSDLGLSNSQRERIDGAQRRVCPAADRSAARVSPSVIARTAGTLCRDGPRQRPCHAGHSHSRRSFGDWSKSPCNFTARWPSAKRKSPANSA